MLHRMIQAAYGWRGEFQVASRYRMCRADRMSPGDAEEAYACGRRAVELAVAGRSGVMVSIMRESDDPYRWSLGTAPLAEVALARSRCPTFSSPPRETSSPRPVSLYLRPLIGPLPDYVRLSEMNG